MKNTGALCERKENRLEIIRPGVNFRLWHSFDAYPLARNWVSVSLHEKRTYSNNTSGDEDYMKYYMKVLWKS